MTVNIAEWTDNLVRAELGPVVHAKAALLGRLRRLLGRAPAMASTSRLPQSLQLYADVYGEQVTADALADLDKYFKVIGPLVSGATLGGLSTEFWPLNILARGVRPSNTAVAVLGEGLAGWYLENRGLVPRSRPIAEPGGPDIIFQDVAGAAYSLVQVKATQEPSIRPRMPEAAFALLDYAHKLVPVRSTRYSCVVVGVEIQSASDFNLRSLTIRLT